MSEMKDAVNRGITRRDLLKRSVLGGGALLISPALLEACASTPAVTSSPKRGGTLRVGVVGNGQAEKH